MAVGNRLTVKATTLPPASADFDLYVDPTHGNDTNSGTSTAAPLRTVAAAVAVIGNEGVIGLMAGAYPVLSMSDVTAAGLTILSMRPKRAVLERVYLTGTSNVILRDLRVRFPDPGVPRTPAQALDVVQLDGCTDILVDNCQIEGETMLRTGRGVRTDSNATRVVVRGCEIANCGRGGVRFGYGTNTDCVVENCEIHGIVETAIGNQGTGNTGFVFRRNLIYDMWARPDDPDWSSEWQEGHYSLISLRDAVGVTIEENIVHSVRTTWIQLYDGEFGLTYSYGDLIVRGNLFHSAPDDGYAFLLQATDTERVGPVVIENNSWFAAEKDGWDSESFSGIVERLERPIVHLASLGAFQTGDIIADNLIASRCILPNWATNNVCWLQIGGEPANNFFVPNTEPYWFDDRMVFGTFDFSPVAAGSTRPPGLTFTPQAGTTLATYGRNGSHVGYIAPA